MNTNFVIGLLTAIGVMFAIWTFPVVAPIMDNALAEPYICIIDATHNSGMDITTDVEVWSTEFKERKVYNGIKFEELFKSQDGEYFANTTTPNYKYIQMHCVRK